MIEKFCFILDRFGRVVCVKMPGVQNKYTVDTNNRFFVDDDENEDDVEDVENVDPFEQLKQLNKQAEDAKNAPKPKVNNFYNERRTFFGE